MGLYHHPSDDNADVPAPAESYQQVPGEDPVESEAAEAATRLDD